MIIQSDITYSKLHFCRLVLCHMISQAQRYLVTVHQGQTLCH